MPEPLPSPPKSPVPNPDPRTIGVALLTGDPKKAILKLSGPMIVVMLLMSTYNLVNAIWVAGLGPDALAAVGFVSPLFMVLVGIGNGLGAGATSVISRRIGAGDHAGANSAAVHALLLTIVISAIATVPLVLLADPILIAFGAGGLRSGSRQLQSAKPSGRVTQWLWASVSVARTRCSRLPSSFGAVGWPGPDIPVTRIFFIFARVRRSNVKDFRSIYSLCDYMVCIVPIKSMKRATPISPKESR